MDKKVVQVGKVGMVPKGEWNNSTKYENLDIVSYNENSFIAGANVPVGTTPTNNEYWTQLTNLNEAKIIFMPINTAPEGARTSSECTIIISKTGKVLMIDSGRSHSKSLIINELEKNHITHIDYLIITHYHTDHTDNIWYTGDGTDNFVTRYMDSTTKAYLPSTGRLLGFAWMDDGDNNWYVSSGDDNTKILKNYTIEDNIVTNILPTGWKGKWSRKIEENVIGALQSKNVTIYPEEIETIENVQPTSINANQYTLISDTNIIAPNINTNGNDENNDLQEYDSFEFDGIKIDFLNTRKKDFKYYIYAALYGASGIDWNINNLSIVNRITVGETTCLMTGDIEKIAEEYLYGDITTVAQMNITYMSNDSAKQQTYFESSERVNFVCDILKVPHHMQEAYVCQDFYLRLQPKIAVVTTNFEFAQTGGARASGAVRCLNHMNTPTYIVGKKSMVINITSNSYMAYPTTNPYYVMDVGTPRYVNIYVNKDIASLEYADGSKHHPYNDLNTAISQVKNSGVNFVAINIEGTYTYGAGQSELDTENIFIDSVKPVLKIIGDAVITYTGTGNNRSNMRTNSNIALNTIRVRNSCVLLEKLRVRTIAYENSTGGIESCRIGGLTTDNKPSIGFTAKNSIVSFDDTVTGIVLCNSAISNTNSLVKSDGIYISV